MTIVIDTNPSKQRPLALDEEIDQHVKAGDYFGTTGDGTGQVWHFDGITAVRVGVPNPDHRSMTTLKGGESLRQALQRVPMFEQRKFVLHCMELPPGAYYHRISRPNDQHPVESLGALPEYWKSPNLMASTLNQMRFLVGMLDEIFQAVHPAEENMDCFGNSIRNLLILACTECEAQWRGVLAANGVVPNHPTTRDYVKLLPAMRLSEYAVKLQHYPWLDPVAPFDQWSSAASTKSLTWYDNYNAAKHDREAAFSKASIRSAIQAVAAVWIMVASQFGIHGIREFDDLYRYFHLESVPRWRYSEVYTYGYNGFDKAAGPISFPF